MSARVLDCPQCGAPVNFRSSIAVFAVCEHCHSMVVLRGANAELIGVMAALPPDLSPFQIGTRGEWKGRAFEIVGRIRVEWEQGSWNEWCLLYNGTEAAWLAEAQGLLMISLPADAKEIPPNPESFPIKNQLQLNGKWWVVTDVKTVTYRASEGELPFAAPPDHQQVSMDLMDQKGGFAGVEFSPDGPELYMGEFVRFDDLRLTNLRPVPGWSTEVAQEKNRTTALPCPNCGAPIELRAAGQSMAATCGSCRSLIDTAKPELQLIEKAEAVVRKIAPLLPIGQRGKLFDIEYEVVGLVNRKDEWSQWSEYLLFNPWQGFRWLVFFQGHWSFIERLPALPNMQGKKVSFEHQTYKLFAENKATVADVLGEFYWQVRRGEQAEVADYIAPPFVLSKETYPGLVEVAWSRGEYVDRRIIKEAFNVDKLPRPQGSYLNEPNKFAKRWKEIRAPFLFALIALCLVQFFFASGKEAVVSEGSFVFDQLSKYRMPTASNVSPEGRNTFTTPRFALTGRQQRVSIEAEAPVDNNWLGLDLDLVNADTNTSQPANLEVSYYHGYDSDGAWTEGKRTARTAWAAVPPGNYFVTAEASADQSIQTLPFTLKVTSGGTFNSNFILMLGLVLLYPILLLWRRSRFEQARWADSDFSP
jgi:hypothetical protein